MYIPCATRYIVEQVEVVTREQQVLLHLRVMTQANPGRRGDQRTRSDRYLSLNTRSGFGTKSALPGGQVHELPTVHTDASSAESEWVRATSLTSRRAIALQPEGRPSTGLARSSLETTTSVNSRTTRWSR